MKSCKSWGYIATVIIGLALVSGALADRLTTFAWDPDPSWPAGTTIELCGNGPTCQTGLTGLSATLSLPVNPGDVIQGMARAIPPPGYQCGEPLTDCLPSEWGAVQATWPANPIGGWARYQREETTPVADPVFQNRGTLDYRAGNFASSLSSTITGVQAGDLLIVQVQRDQQANITGVASASPALTFSLARRLNSGSSKNFSQDIWTALATADAASMTITASYSNSEAWGSMISYRWSGGIESATPSQTNGHTTLQEPSTNRTSPNITTTQRALLIAAGTDWDFYLTHTPATNWTKILDSQTLGTDSATMFLHAQIADAGTYPNGNFATVSAADRYMSSIIAYEVETSAAASLPPHITNPTRAFAHLLVR